MKLIVTCLSCYVLLAGCQDAPDIKAQSQFVHIHEGQFSLQDQEFAIVGVSSRGLLAKVSSELQHSNKSRTVDELLARLAEIGCSVVRLNLAQEQHVLDPTWTESAVEPRTLAALDYFLNLAVGVGLRVIVGVTDYELSNGVSAFVHEEQLPIDDEEDLGEFFINPIIRESFASYLQQLTQRKNSINGVRYAQDPTIFSWELLNAPIGAGATAADIRDWVYELRSALASQEIRQMVSMGDIGYGTFRNQQQMIESVSYLSETVGAWLVNGSFNIEFESNLQAVDFASIQCHPEQWSPASGQAELICDHWTRLHAFVSAKQNKPLVVTSISSDPTSALGNEQSSAEMNAHIIGNWLALAEQGLVSGMMPATLVIKEDLREHSDFYWDHDQSLDSPDNQVLKLLQTHASNLQDGKDL